MLSRVTVIILRNMLTKIRSLGLGTMIILNRNWVVEIAQRVSRSFQLQDINHLVFHPPRTGMTIRVEHQTLNLRKVFQAPRLTSLSLSVVRTIRASVLHEKRNVLGAIILVTV